MEIHNLKNVVIQSPASEIIQNFQSSR
ncbi:hypothetical protein NP493_1148g00067 [Ridgeia piscesae]|uniref:Uncharacterized protein n=1 Tax=Ridgeia piscesae TaxID=27915 RepID=A0AAD9NJ99_RIDPI|nr:hypothetical protein NP493_1148g00067 [Ridgeia piscesae]